MPIKNLWFNYRLECIEVFLARAFQVQDRYNAAFMSSEVEVDRDEFPETLQELEHANDILLGYQDIVFRAVYGELNALVELELKNLAKSIMSSKGEKRRTLNRGNVRTLIEREYGIPFEDLPRFEEVNEVRKVMNAYKHEDGFSDECEEAFPGAGWIYGFFHTRYKLSWEKSHQSIQAVKEFLLALPGNREHLPERRPKLEDAAVIKARDQVWEDLRQSGALGHQLGASVAVARQRGGYSATCELCGKSFWAEHDEVLHVLAALDREHCPGARDFRKP